jgi:hypothetical protein
VLSNYVVTLATLEVWVAATGTALQAAIWGVLAVQGMLSARQARHLASGATGAGPVGGDMGQGYGPTPRDGDERI